MVTLYNTATSDKKSIVLLQKSHDINIPSPSARAQMNDEPKLDNDKSNNHNKINNDGDTTETIIKIHH